MTRWWFLVPAVAALIGVLPLAAPAQEVPTPGQIQESLRPRLSVPRGSAPTPLPTPPPAAAGVAVGGPVVLVERFDISGNKALATEDLQAVVAPYQGRPLTLQQIYEVADALTHYYRTHGYTLATANVPAQKIGSGVIRLEVLEGTLGKVTVEGNRHYRTSFIEKQLDLLVPGQPLRNAPLEHELLLLNDLPGLHAQAVVRPGTEFGSSDVAITTTEKFAEGGVRFNNYGRKSIGEDRFEGNGALNGLLGIGDKLEVNGVIAEEARLKYGRLAYGAPLTPWGTRATVYYSGYDYAVDPNSLPTNLRTLDIDGEGINFGVNFQHPVWRSRNKNLYVGLGFDRTVTDQTEHTFGGRTKQNLSLGVLSANFEYVGSDHSVSTLGGTFSTNFEGADLIRDATTGGLRVENNAETAKLQLDLSHYRTLYKQLAFYGRFTGVLSADPLHDLDRFRLGGPTNVRAYPSSEIAGDEGYFMSTELQHPVPFFTGSPSLLKVFFDNGRVYRQQHNQLGVRAGQSLSGIGVGLQTSFWQRIYLDFILAQPLGAYHATDRDHGVRFWMGVSANF